MHWHDLSIDLSEPAAVLELTLAPDCPSVEPHVYVIGSETYASWLLDNGKSSRCPVREANRNPAGGGALATGEEASGEAFRRYCLHRLSARDVLIPYDSSDEPRDLQVSR